MVARSQRLRIGGGALTLGLLVGATIGVVTSGHGSTTTGAAPTTTSRATTTTASPAPNTTIVTVGGPSVVEFVASPATAVCGRNKQRTRVLLTWVTQDTQSVALQADGATVADGQPPTGTQAMAFDCPAEGETVRHELVLTATGTDGTTTAQRIPVAVTTTTTSGGGD
jgi:hypothetical protein